MSASHIENSHLNSGLETRIIAAMLLDAVLERGRPLEAELNSSRRFLSLDAQERAFCQRLLKTALKYKGQADALLALWLERPLSDMPTIVQQILRLGVTQIMWMETSDHAAVNTMVEAAKSLKRTTQTGLVNAVLRRCLREGKDALTKMDALAVTLPEWLWQSWCEAYGDSNARKLVRLMLQEPALDITVKEGPESWAEKLKAELLPNGSLRLEDAGSVTGLEGFEDGAWWVQDAAAAMPVHLLEQTLGSLENKKIIDFCAAPGGKTAQMASSGTSVTAVDLSAKRLKQLEENLERLHLKAECIEGDAYSWKPSFTPEAILLDAPCSATGTLRRHPDVAWHRTPEDIARLAEVQRKMLTHSYGLLPEGGVLLYAVCSLQPEEGKLQIERFLEAHPTAELASFSLLPPLLGSQYLPATTPTDGFFAAAITKTASEA